MEFETVVNLENMQMHETISVSTACIVNESKQILLVRKRGTRFFMLPGGKPERGESALAALQRELWEELGLPPDRLAYSYVGNYLAPAANEADTLVAATVYMAALTMPIAMAAEIDEMLWVTPEQLPDVPLAQLFTDHVLPAFLRIKV